MNLELLNLFALFFVIIDPIKGFIYFFLKTNTLSKKERKNIAYLSIGIGLTLVYVFLFFGTSVLEILNININVFRIAGGILLALSGGAMCGVHLIVSDIDEDEEKEDENLTTAIVIATPLLTGPAAITTIILSVIDKGVFLTGLAATLVFIFALLLFLSSTFFTKIFNRSKIIIRVISTILGLITLSNGIKFILIGLHFIS